MIIFIGRAGKYHEWDVPDHCRTAASEKRRRSSVQLSWLDRRLSAAAASIIACFRADKLALLFKIFCEEKSDFAQ